MTIGDFRADGEAMRYFGIYPAIVTDIVDTEQLGRIEVKFPWLGADADAVRAWAKLLTPYAGEDQGFLVLPAVDTEVIVGFFAGDLRHPYIVGSAWNGKEALPETPAAPNNKRLIKTRAGSLLEFDDTEDASKVTLSMKKGYKLVLDDSSEEVKLTHFNGCVMTFTASGQVQIEAGSTVEITASAVNVHAATVKCDGAVVCEALNTKSVVSNLYSQGAGNIW
jgi:uncharacterized protein involved in type VI secretion and phage assembly